MQKIGKPSASMSFLNSSRKKRRQYSISSLFDGKASRSARIAVALTFPITPSHSHTAVEIAVGTSPYRHGNGKWQVSTP